MAMGFVSRMVAGDQYVFGSDVSFRFLPAAQLETRIFVGSGWHYWGKDLGATGGQSPWWVATVRAGDFSSVCRVPLDFCLCRLGGIGREYCIALGQSEL